MPTYTLTILGRRISVVSSVARIGFLTDGERAGSLGTSKTSHHTDFAGASGGFLRQSPYGRPALPGFRVL